MPGTFATLLTLATLSGAAPLLHAQTTGPGNNDVSYTESSDTQPAAPIERSYAPPQQQGPRPQQRPMNATSEPIQGVWLVTAPGASVQTVAATPEHTELRVERGRANVDIHHPADDSELLVDLPGGQVSLLKDGLYTFNADTNTVRVLRGEAEVSISNAKAVKVKEEHQFTFGANGSQPRAQEASPNQLRSDLLQRNGGDGREGYRIGEGYRNGDGYAYGPYRYGFAYGGYPYYSYGYPYYAFGRPFGYGYPFGYGVGIGFGYYGGYRYGGFRGFRR